QPRCIPAPSASGRGTAPRNFTVTQASAYSSRWRIYRNADGSILENFLANEMYSERASAGDEPGTDECPQLREVRRRLLTFTNIGIATNCASTEKTINANSETSYSLPMIMLPTNQDTP